LERFTISLSDSLAADFDQWLQTRGYTNRSEGVRDLLRKEIEKERIKFHKAEHSIATLSFVYNHHERTLAERLTSLQHKAHDLVICSNHVHLDHDNCLECLYLQGPTAVLQQFADTIAAEPGVRHSVINLIPVQLHKHANKHHLHKEHFHIQPFS
jgi:CopG family transcriptional regulator, nickel-responsive regulator